MVKKVIVKRVSRSKYVAVRMPRDVYNEAVKVQEALEKTGAKLMGKRVGIPLTRVFRIKMSTPTTIPDETIKRIIKKK